MIATREACHVVTRLTHALDGLDVLGVDMPIGLPESDRRACDHDARRLLSPRGSTVFPTPPRSLVHHTEYADANAESKARYARGLSRQAFALFPKIREVDAIVGRYATELVEIHPECAFTRLAGHVLTTKHAAQGLARRRSLLEGEFGPLPTRVRGAAEADLLDAYAVLWSALRYARGEHVEFGDGAVDARGIPMRIVS